MMLDSNEQHALHSAKQFSLTTVCALMSVDSTSNSNLKSFKKCECRVREDTPESAVSMVIS
jgi:hypothetical protein